MSSAGQLECWPLIGQFARDPVLLLVVTDICYVGEHGKLTAQDKQHVRHRENIIENMRKYQKDVDPGPASFFVVDVPLVCFYDKCVLYNVYNVSGVLNLILTDCMDLKALVHFHLL